MVYLVYKDNGECYEDYCECVNKVFNTKEQAQKYITQQKRKKENKQNRMRNAIRFWIVPMEVE